MESLTEKNKTCQVRLFIEEEKDAVGLVKSFPVCLSAQEIYAQLRSQFQKIYNFAPEDHYGFFYPENKENTPVQGLSSKYLEVNEVYKISVTKKIRKK